MAVIHDIESVKKRETESGVEWSGVKLSGLMRGVGG